jgi:succinate dehydrogenase / fumarate reductase cytochrome b subunit
MAVTGLVLFGFVAGHMAGNLKTFQGAEKLNHYAEHLRLMGMPIFDRGQVLWIARLVLLASLGVHVAATISLARANWAARPERYAYRQRAKTSAVSRTMIVTGPLLLAFVVFHILHFTTGQAHPDFHPGEVFANVVTGFRGHPVVVGIYVVGMTALGAHLFHGLWSLFQTLGLDHPRWNGYRRGFAIVASLVVAGGFVLVPIAVALGLVG